jgi:hypothetical protein
MARAPSAALQFASVFVTTWTWRQRLGILLRAARRSSGLAALAASGGSGGCLERDNPERAVNV